MLLVAWPEVRPFADVRVQVGELERLGMGRFGWGVAWLSGEGVTRVRGLGSYADEVHEDRRLAEARSSRFLVHLRRPNLLSTISLFDTQPFVVGREYAWCHNGFFTGAERLRPTYAAQLKGTADSEVGWAFFQELLAQGSTPEQAMQKVDHDLGGSMNLAYLSLDGTLMAYARNDTNPMWTFRVGDATMASTSVHSKDESLFDLIFPTATDRRQLAPGTGVVVGEPFL
jgi:glutamine phosphoribosylpyrophosphate amidotransferase